MDKKKIFAVLIGIVVLLAFVIHPGVPDKRVPLKNKLAVILPLIVIFGLISLYIIKTSTYQVTLKISI
ncbi:hypothetical protein [Bacillus cereus]|uniref:hypothetical protein n=2 Tax=Bacillus cereus group TaxID=86661 RepID=UPI0018F7C3B9|nr:hypothetical protein [Bacillus cereus]MBJ7986491.1 hypothetical protein [Bacillus cereus]